MRFGRGAASNSSPARGFLRCTAYGTVGPDGALSVWSGPVARVARNWNGIQTDASVSMETILSGLEQGRSMRRSGAIPTITPERKRRIDFHIDTSVRSGGALPKRDGPACRYRSYVTVAADLASDCSES